MFYTGFGNSQYNNSAIGYATSEDGLIWGKHSGNPIISDISGYPKLQAPAAMLDGERWIMYFDAGENGQPLNRFILRATAPAPEGPWDVDEIPAIEGRARTWDQRSLPVTELLVDGVYYLFYNGVGSPDGPQMGLATSPDYQTWSLYNDPGTTERLYEFSDPDLKSGPAAHGTLAA
jgi:hypothetical protein